MPWDATPLRVAAVLEDGTLGPSDLAAGGLDESIVQPEWAPDGMLHFVSRPQRLVEPLPAGATGRGSCRWRRWRRSSPTRLDLGPLELRVPRRWLDRRGRSVGAAATGSIHIGPGEQVGEVRSPYTEFDGAPRRPRGGRRHRRRAERARRSSSASTRRPSRRPGSCATRRRQRVDPRLHLRRPNRSRSRPTGGRTGPRAVLPPRNPAAAAPDGERPPLVVAVPRRPDRQRLDRAGRSSPAADDARHRRRRCRLRREHGLRAGLPTRRSRARGAIADVDDCVAAARYPGRARRRGRGAAGDRGRQRRRLHDAGRARLPRHIRGRASARSGSPTSRCIARDSHKFESRYKERPASAPYPAMAERISRSLADPLSSTRSRAPVLILQGLEDSVVPPAQAEAIVAALEREGIPYALSRLRGRGPRLPGRDAHPRGRSRRGSRSSARSSGSRPADDLPPLELHGHRARGATDARRLGSLRLPAASRTRPACTCRRPRATSTPSSSSSCCSSLAVGIALHRPAGRASPSRSCSSLAGVVARPFPGPPARSSSSPTSSSCCSCRRSCSRRPTSRRSATSGRTLRADPAAGGRARPVHGRRRRAGRSGRSSRA